MPGPLTPLLDLPDVREAAARASASVDGLLSQRVLRRGSALVSAESALRGAWASAALEGADHDLDAVRAGTVTDPLLQGALRVSGAIGELTGTWERAPRQVLARLHLLAARDLVAEDELGRPVNDPEVATRLDGLAGLVAAGPDDTPAVIVAAVVHGELLALRAFSGPNGVVARAAARLTLISRGLDPKGVSVPEAGHLARRPEYVGAATAYKTGTRDGVRAWLRHCCAAVELGAAEGVASCAAVASQ